MMTAGVLTWETSAEDGALRLPCDRHVPGAEAAYYRAVDVSAPPPVLFRWLCQLKAAPYSYDWLDNCGRPSPRQCIPGLEDLALGQRVMTIFELVEFEPDRHITLRMDSAWGESVFGEIAITYLILPRSDDASCLMVKLRVRYPERGLARLMRWLLPAGDAFMMRKQLLTLKELAERE